LPRFSVTFFFILSALTLTSAYFGYGRQEWWTWVLLALSPLVFLVMRHTERNAEQTVGTPRWAGLVNAIWITAIAAAIYLWAWLERTFYID
jgi:Ca2+/H+ antiporter